MVPTKARKNLLINKFVNAVAGLEDITTIHTDPNLTSMRVNLMRGDSDGAPVSDDIVRAFEVLGIAKAVAARFRGAPWRATRAAFDAGTLSGSALSWFARRDAGAGARGLGESDDGYRAFLLTHLDWVHNYGTVHDGATANASTCLCPVTAYLQLILRRTPVEDWAVAATADPNASPLAFAWAWARTSPWIGRRTADVVALVTMGRHVHRLMADEPVRAEEMRAMTKSTAEVLGECVLALLLANFEGCLMGAATLLRGSPSYLTNYERVHGPDGAKELLGIVQNAATKLGEEGERYALLLGEKDVAQECIVDSIRILAGFILGKTEPPTPENVFLAVEDLATAD